MKHFGGLIILVFLTASCTWSGQPPSTTASTTAIPTISTTEQAKSADVRWLIANAVPFETAEPNSSFEDLMPLKQTVGDARIVALGEATHGTHEFFQMKHRMLQFLVQ